MLPKVSLRNGILSLQDNAEQFRQFAFSFIIKIGGAVLMLAMQVVLARMLGITQYGEYIYVYSWMILASIITTFGFERLLTKYIPEFEVRQEWQDILGVIWTSTKIVFLLAVAVSIIGAVVVWQLRGNLPIVSPWTFGFGFCFLFCISIMRPLSGALRGFKRVLAASFFISIFLPSLILATCGAVYLFFGNLFASQAMSLTAFSAFVGLSAVFILLCHTIQSRVPKAISRKQFQLTTWLKIAFPFVLISGAHQIQRYTDTLMLGSLQSIELAGVYGAVSQVTQVLLLGTLSINMVAAPMLSSYYAAGKMAELNQLVRIISGLSLGITVVVAIATLIEGRTVLTLFGPQFAGGYTAMSILMFGHVVRSVVGPAELISVMTGREWNAFRAVGTSAVLNIILNAILIPYYGLVGAAIATTTTLTIWNVWLAVDASKNLRIRTSIFQWV